ncbi:helix-turn-helix domain-containing protein [uncultured Shewanella sp.]|uniref:helix-turn-helix domain-containing protein n=1 Tax=uncultured Shewanella sp. TaxID=173975 RepID=UPI00370384F0
MNKFGQQLRFWRTSRRLSQLDLALEANVSTKHISFIETGRAKPSKEMVMNLCEVLSLPLRNRNELITLAGFAEQYVRTPLSDNKKVEVASILELIVAKHEPFPAIVVDWYWNVVIRNKGFDKLIALMEAENPQCVWLDNIAHWLMHPNGLRHVMTNWQEVAKTTLQRLNLENQYAPKRHDELIQSLYQYPGVANLLADKTLIVSTEPFIYLDIVVCGKTLRFLTTLTSFGTPLDITASELLMEHYYPANAQTEQFLKSL